MAASMDCPDCGEHVVGQRAIADHRCDVERVLPTLHELREQFEPVEQAIKDATDGLVMGDPDDDPEAPTLMDRVQYLVSQAKQFEEAFAEAKAQQDSRFEALRERDTAVAALRRLAAGIESEYTGIIAQDYPETLAVLNAMPDKGVFLYRVEIDQLIELLREDQPGIVKVLESRLSPTRKEGA